MSTPKAKISANDVIDIFSRYAGGATLAQVAERFPFSSAVVAQVLHRKRMGHVPVPPKIAAAVQERLSVRPPRSKPRQQGLTPAIALAAFMAACVQLRRTRNDCLRIGVQGEVLDLLQEAERDAGGEKAPATKADKS
jgi:hypothetical protein